MSKWKKHSVFLLAGLALMLNGCVAPDVIYADELDDAISEVEITSLAYDSAVAEYNNIEEEIRLLNAEIEVQENYLAAHKNAAFESAVSLYKMSQDPGLLIRLILNSQDLRDAITALDNYETIISHHLSAGARYQQAKDTLTNDKIALDEKVAIASIAMDEAQSAKENAIAIREQLQAEAEAREAEERKAKQEQASEHGVSASDIDWGMSKEEFVVHWGQRIDAYLAGSPLSGYGELFAEASYDTGADPRFSPAISTIESGTGRINFAPYNAWGWMVRTDFTSWEESIPQHVEYLCSSIYGTNGYLTRSFASTYCPPNAEHWYQRVSQEMSKI